VNTPGIIMFVACFGAVGAASAGMKSEGRPRGDRLVFMAAGAVASAGSLLFLIWMPRNWSLWVVVGSVVGCALLVWRQQADARRRSPWPAITARFPERARPAGGSDAFEVAQARTGVLLAALRRRWEVVHDPHFAWCFVGVHDAGLYLRPQAGSADDAPGAFVPWDAVGECRRGSLGYGRHAPPAVWLVLPDGLGEIAVEENPAGEEALVRYAAWRRRRRSFPGPPRPAA
jgi:hypothetical protein